MLERIAKGYRIPLIDYGRPSSGLLVASGSGIMMAVMDACPVFRWCFDQDELSPMTSLSGFLKWSTRYCNPIGLAGWFTVSDPEPIRTALRCIKNPLVYGGNTEFGVGVEVRTVGEFIALANRHHRRSVIEKVG